MYGRSRWFVAVAAAAGLLGGLLTAPPPARACGGFFCQTTPIDQSGEQIVFSVTKDSVEAHILISYQGNAKDFAWVVPVMAKPEIAVGSQQLFTALQQRTRPVWGIDWTFTGGSGFCGGFGPERGAAGTAPPAAPGGGDTKVNVLDEREVGPYQTVTLESKDPEALVKWLNENGFVQPPSAAPLITHYVKNNFLFVALKLKQNAATGEIQPLVLRTPIGEPCVPLILTRVAAMPDMPVLVYVLGSARAFPSNWFHVEINQKKVSWTDGGQNYNKVATDAINEAAGRGFVTDYAGNSDIMKNALWSPGRYDLSRAAGITDPVQLLQTLLSLGLPRDQTMQALLRKYIPMPQSLVARGVMERDFYNNLAAYRADLMGFQVNTTAFLAEIEERIITPLKQAQGLFDVQPYLTRLFATVSADEMTRDPLFIFNPHMPKVSNVHTAKGTGECLPDGTIRNGILTLENGEKITLPDLVRRFPPTPWEGGRDENAYRRIQLVGTSGTPSNYTMAQAKVVDQLLDGQDPDSVRSRVIPDGASRATRGCNVGDQGSVGAGLAGLLALLALLVNRRRRP